MALDITTRPLHPTFGVELRGIDLSRIGEPEVYAALRDAFDRHSLVLVRGQALSPDDHKALARAFGPLENRESMDLAEGADFEVPQVSNRQKDGSISGAMDMQTLNLKANMLWHTDGTFLPVPALANVITARVVTSTGGATELVSTRAAWADMPEALRARVRDAVIHHDYSVSRRKIAPELAFDEKFTKWPVQRWRALWRNPVTGEDALYIASHAFRIDGMADAEAEALIEELVAFCTTPERVYAHRWAVGDVLIWDERATLHRGTPWPYEEERTLSSICVSARDVDGLGSVRPAA